MTIREPVSRRAVALAAAAAALVAPGLARAQAGAYPSRPVRVVVPFAAGSSPDVIARLLAERVTRASPHPVVVENRAGAATIVGTQHVGQSPADGHTFLYGVNNTFSVNPFIFSRLPYRAEDFVPVVKVLDVPFVLLVRAAHPLRSFQQMVEAARARPDALSYASLGVGQTTHVAMARILNELNAQMTHVPFAGSPLNDVLAGRIDISVEPSTTAVPMLRDGSMRGLAITSPRRMEALPDIPAVSEFLPGYEGQSWHGFFLRAGSPPEAQAWMNGHVNRILGDAEFRARLNEFALVPSGGTVQDFAAFLAEDARIWSAVARNNNIRVD